MKRKVILFIFLLSIIFILPIIVADEVTQVEKAYSCLENKINQTNCSTFSFEEKVFSLLATGNLKCQNQVMSENLSNQCWPKSGCKVKSTAQAVLALNEKEVNTTKAENWLLTQTAVPVEMDWFLEIESSSATSCIITYSGSSYTVLIGENKKISSNAGNSLTLAQDSYWLKIDSRIYNKNIDVSCNKPFITTLLFMKKGSSTIHVSETVHSSAANGRTTEIVNSFCFSEGGVCRYEGSLWATFVLYSLHYDVSKFMPYLITMVDDELNQVYIPESFLYFLTGKFRTELLLKQRAGLYWEESGDKYYDTALALWPLLNEDTFEKDNSKSWLLDVQENTGCWYGGNVRDTAFILYSIWPKDNNPPNPPGECTFDNDCPDVSCKESTCDSDFFCSYELLGCIDDDGCCNSGCTSLTDDDCSPGENECDFSIDCADYVLPDEDNYCSEDKTEVWKNDFEWDCVSKVCEIDETPNKIETCGATEECYNGNCLSTNNIPDECTDYTDCWGEDCVEGECVPFSCTSDDECDSGNCDSGECGPSICTSDDECDSGSCSLSGECVFPGEPLDCESEGYNCMSYINCEGEILYDYSCTGVFECCDTEPSLGICSDEGGTICADDETCLDGTTAEVSDTTYGETCCLGGTCEKEIVPSANCIDNEGKCTSSCGDGEEESFLYDCDYGEICCLAKETPVKTSKAWIWILLVLILFSALGIVFRDKLRTQWMKLKDKFGGKKDKKRFEMPLTSHPGTPNRIFSRGILPPPLSRGPPNQRPTYPQRSLIHKKPEEKPKNELDDVLKKLKEMGK